MASQFSLLLLSVLQVSERPCLKKKKKKRKIDDAMPKVVLWPPYACAYAPTHIYIYMSFTHTHIHTPLVSD